jgi:FkbM family methyltransferase
MVDCAALSHRMNGNWLGRAAKAPLALLPKKMVVPILQGRLRGKKWILGSCVHSCWLGSYEVAEAVQMMATVKQGAVFFDIGAQAGYHTLLAAELVGASGHVFAFEPVPVNIEHIRRHVELNGIRNVTVVESAVSDVDGTIRFSTGTNLLSGHISPEGNVDVPVVSLDTQIEQGLLPDPDFIKIDVEGAELKVLQGARQTLSRRYATLFVETHQWLPAYKSSHRDCCDFLRRLGYDIVMNEPTVLNGAYHICARSGAHSLDSHSTNLASFPQ